MAKGKMSFFIYANTLSLHRFAGAFAGTFDKCKITFLLIIVLFFIRTIDK